MPPVFPPRQFHQFQHEGQFRPYLNRYRFGTEGVAAAVVVYVGGAISRSDYESRRHTSPDALVEPFAEAWAARPTCPVDFVVLPCPTSLGTHREDWILHHYDNDILPLLGQAPTALGCVGYSAGAAHALRLAVCSEAQGLTVIGPAGLSRTVHDLRNLRTTQAQDGRVFRARGFLNNSDNVCRDTRWSSGMPASLRFSWCHREGTHPWREYVANGSAREAFADVLQAVCSPGGAEG